MTAPGPRCRSTPAAMPGPRPALIDFQRAAKDPLHYVWQVRHLFYNAAAHNIIIRSGNWHVHKLISNKQSCILLPCERGQRTPSECTVPGAASAGREFKAMVIFWAAQVRGVFVAGVSGIVRQAQLANGPLPHGMCSLGSPPPGLAASRNWSPYLRFPKREAAKSRK